MSGSVDAGKTHSMRSFTHAIPPDWRIVTVEDTPELIDLPCPNTVHLLYSKGMQSVARVSSTDLVEAALRMGIQGSWCRSCATKLPILREGAGIRPLGHDHYPRPNRLRTCSPGSPAW